jgi:hypothetical protein
MTAASVTGQPCPSCGVGVGEWCKRGGGSLLACPERSRIARDGWKNCRECASGYWSSDDGQLTCKNCQQLENGGK